MSLLSNTRWFRRPLLAAAVMAAGILAAGGATAPAKAQYYPYYSPYGAGYCDPYNPYAMGMATAIPFTGSDSVSGLAGTITDSAAAGSTAAASVAAAASAAVAAADTTASS